MIIKFHPYVDILDNSNWVRRVANAVECVIEYILKEDISVCIPRAIGWRYHHPYEYDRVVVHVPEKFAEEV